MICDLIEKDNNFKEYLKSKGFRFCKECKMFKPERTHHCRQCNNCVLKMDHHCNWLYNCIGFYNYTITPLCKRPPSKQALSKFLILHFYKFNFFEIVNFFTILILKSQKIL